MEMAGHVMIGLLASMLGSMVGIGGGIIIVPALTILMQIDIKEAIGSSLISIVAMSSMASAAYAKKGWIHFQLGYILVVSTLFGSIIGSQIAVNAHTQVLELIFGLFLIVPAVLLLKKPARIEKPTMDSFTGIIGRIKGEFAEFPGQPALPFVVRRIKTQIAAVTASGLFSGLLGIGGGLLNVPVIHQIGGVPFKVAAATSTLMMGLTSLMAVVIFLGSGSVNPSLSANVVLGALLGAYVGPKLSTYVPVGWLIRLLVVLMIVSSLRMIYRALAAGL